MVTTNGDLKIPTRNRRTSVTDCLYETLKTFSVHVNDNICRYHESGLDHSKTIDNSGGRTQDNVKVDAEEQVLVVENCLKLHDEYHQLVTTSSNKSRETHRSFTDLTESDGIAHIHNRDGISRPNRC